MKRGTCRVSRSLLASGGFSRVSVFSESNGFDSSSETYESVDGGETVNSPSLTIKVVTFLLQATATDTLGLGSLRQQSFNSFSIYPT